MPTDVGHRRNSLLSAEMFQRSLTKDRGSARRKASLDIPTVRPETASLLMTLKSPRHAPKDDGAEPMSLPARRRGNLLKTRDSGSTPRKMPSQTSPGTKISSSPPISDQALSRTWRGGVLRSNKQHKGAEIWTQSMSCREGDRRTPESVSLSHSFRMESLVRRVTGHSADCPKGHKSCMEDGEPHSLQSASLRNYKLDLSLRSTDKSESDRGGLLGDDYHGIVLEHVKAGGSSSSTDPDDSESYEELSTVDVLSVLRTVPEKERANYFAFADYGNGDWALDLLSLTHNAVRHECSQMSILLMRFLDNEREFATEYEVLMLVGWYTQFRDFVMLVLEMEEILIFPLLEDTVDPEIARRVLGAERFAARQKIVRSLSRLGRCYNALQHRNIETGLQNIIEAQSELSYRVSEYLHREEKVLPNVIRQAMTQQEAEFLMQHSFLDIIRRRPKGHENIVLLTRWMSPEHLRDWKQSCLPKQMRMSYGFWKSNVLKHETRVAKLASN